MSDDYLPRKAPTEKTAKMDPATSDMAAVLQIPAGRRVIMRILGMAGVYRNAFAGEEAATNFRLGQQDIGLRIIGMIEQVDPTRYPRLLIEHAQEPNEEVVHVVDAEE